MPPKTLFLDFSKKSPRSYRGKASIRHGHDGRRAKDGTFAPLTDETGDLVSRRRWTTALLPEALDQLHDLAVELHLNRCEVVEILLLDPACRDRAREIVQERRRLAQPQEAPATAAAVPTHQLPEPAPPSPAQPKGKRLSKEESTKVNTILEMLLAQGRATTAELQRVADASGMELNAIQQRVSRLRRRVGVG